MMNQFSNLGRNNKLWRRVQRHATMSTLFGGQTTAVSPSQATIPTSHPLIQPDIIDSPISNPLFNSTTPAPTPLIARQQTTPNKPLDEATATPPSQPAIARHQADTSTQQPDSLPLAKSSIIDQQKSPLSQTEPSTINRSPITHSQSSSADPNSSKNDPQWQQLQRIFDVHRAKNTAVSEDKSDAPPPVPNTAVSSSIEPQSPSHHKIDPTIEPAIIHSQSTSVDPNSSKNDPQWQQLQRIFDVHRAKDAAVSEDKSDAPPPVPDTAVSPSSEQPIFTPPTHTTQSATSIQRQPLEAVWPVESQPYIPPEKSTGDTAPESVQKPAIDRTKPTISRQESTTVQNNLAHVAPKIETDTPVELIMPTRPRPHSAKPEPTDSTASLPSQETAVPSPQPNLPISQSPNPPINRMVETEIGPLPADLWQTLGKTPPSQAQPITTQSTNTPADTPSTSQSSQSPANIQRTAHTNATPPTNPQPINSPSPTSATPPTPIKRTATQYTNTPIHQYTNTPIHQYTNTPIPPHLQSAFAPATQPPIQTKTAVSPQPTFTLQRESIEDVLAETAVSTDPPLNQEIEEPESDVETSNLDIDDLSRQVYQQLRRQLQIDRERGRGK